MPRLLSGRIPHVCGGETDNDIAAGQCFSYDFESGEWVSSGILIDGNRSDSSYAHSDDWGLVASGGHRLNEEGDYISLDTTFATQDAVHFEFLPALPEPRESVQGRQNCSKYYSVYFLWHVGGRLPGDHRRTPSVHHRWS